MICPNCKSHVENSVEYCNYCGEKLKSTNNHSQQYQYSQKYSTAQEDYSKTHDTQYSYSELYSNTNSYQITSDEDYIKYYVGNNYEQLKQSTFSIPAFILGPIYLAHRKMWKELLAYMLIVGLVLYYYPPIFEVTIAIMNVYLGLKFKEIYFEKVYKNIDTIKMNNPDKTSGELLQECQKKGGTISLERIITIIIIIAITISVLSAILMFLLLSFQ